MTWEQNAYRLGLNAALVLAKAFASPVLMRKLGEAQALLARHTGDRAAFAHDCGLVDGLVEVLMHRDIRPIPASAFVWRARA